MNATLAAYWFAKRPNFGDDLNYPLIKLLSRTEPILVPEGCNRPHYFCIGSILHFANRHSVIWGSGMISKEKQHLPKEKPGAIHAVRGPLTRKALLEAGIDCPEIYGDPALLLPKIYQPEQPVEQRFELGIIPHFVDKEHPWLQKVSLDPAIRVIDVQDLSLENFIKALLSCKTIISSSLHGLIVADAYGIPSGWISFKKGGLPFLPKKRVIGKGFKFQDYFASVGRPSHEPVIIKKSSTLSQATENIQQHPIRFNAEPLLQACPFLSSEGLVKPVHHLNRLPA